MNRCGLCIRMLQLLNSHNRLSIQELADFLETNPRNVSEYKKELESAGYYIETKTGRYGGYALNQKCLIPALNLTDEERSVISSSVEYLNKRHDFLYNKEYQNIISKLLSNVRSKHEDEVLIYYRYPLIMEKEEIKKRYDIIKYCMLNKCKIDIVYSSLENVNKNHKISPYELFMYNNAWFALAFDEAEDKLLYFKLNRIVSYIPSTENFRIPIYYNRSEYLDEFGFKNNGELYEVQLEITGKNSRLIKERVYGREQKITEIDDNKCILDVAMRNKDDIISFILKMKTNCRVLKPEWLKEEVKETLKSMMEIYK